MSEGFLLVAPMLLPLLGAAVALLVRGHAHTARLTNLVASVLLLAVSVALFLQARTGSLQQVVLGNWPGGGVGISLSATWPGAALVPVTALIALAASIYAFGDIGPRRQRSGYDALILALIGAVNGAFLTDDLFNLYVWFELALVAALGLLTLDRRLAQIDGAIRYAAFAMLAATMILIGVGLIYGITGTLDMRQAGLQLAGHPPKLAAAAAGALLLSGFMLKAGLVPFHLWLPASYHTAPTTVIAVFAGLLTKMGFFALLLVFAGLFRIGAGGSGAAQLVPVLTWVAAASMLLCAAGALAQTDMRRVLAYHVIAQVGYMMAGLALATQDGIAAAVFYMIHSIIVQTNLFLGAGLIHQATGTWDLTRAGGIVRHHPLLAFLFAVPVLSLAGIPPLSGFWAKMIVIRESLDAGMVWLAMVAILAGLMTIVSMALFWSDSCWKAARSPGRPVSPFGLVAMALLSLATVAVGLAPQELWVIAQLSARVLGGAA